MEFKQRAVLRAKANYFEDFTMGRVFKHHWGRTLNEADNSLFTTLTLHYNPIYFNAEYARAHGHPREQVNPLLVFSTAFGMSVQDLSEGGGFFLGTEDVTYHAPVYPGDTITSESEVVALRESGSNPEAGIVTWHTKGFNQKGVMVVDFKRTNMIRRRPKS